MQFSPPETRGVFRDNAKLFIAKTQVEKYITLHFRLFWFVTVEHKCSAKVLFIIYIYGDIVYNKQLYWKAQK